MCWLFIYVSNYIFSHTTTAKWPKVSKTVRNECSHRMLYEYQISYCKIIFCNKKVLLRERKRHTARRIASARYAALSGGGDTPSQVWGGGVPRSGLDGGGGYPIPGLGGYPSQGRGRQYSPGFDGGGHPIPGQGYPFPGRGYPSQVHWVLPGWGTPQTWDGVPPTIKTWLGYPPPLGWGTPHQPDLRWGTPTPGMGTPSQVWPWTGYPPFHTWEVVPPPPPSRPGRGTPPLPKMLTDIHLWKQYLPSYFVLLR